MSRKNYLSLVGSIFLVIAAVHALRLIYGVPVGFGAGPGFREIPMWVSWLGVALAGYLSWTAFKFSKHQ